VAKRRCRGGRHQRDEMEHPVSRRFNALTVKARVKENSPTLYLRRCAQKRGRVYPRRELPAAIWIATRSEPKVNTMNDSASVTLKRLLAFAGQPGRRSGTGAGETARRALLSPRGRGRRTDHHSADRE
jgi:hypothetical protein